MTTVKTSTVFTAQTGGTVDNPIGAEGQVFVDQEHTDQKRRIVIRNGQIVTELVQETP